MFDDQVRHNLGLRGLAIGVTATETEHVAECLRHGVAYRIHGTPVKCVKGGINPS